MKKINIKQPKFRITLKKHQKSESNDITFWMALLVLLVSNFAISIVLIPFLIILEKVPLYLIISLIGIMFGALFKLTLESISNLENKHHYIAQFFIPALAIINIAVITVLSNKLDVLLELNIIHNPVTLGLIYALAFILPFIYIKILKKIKLLF